MTDNFTVPDYNICREITVNGCTFSFPRRYDGLVHAGTGSFGTVLKGTDSVNNVNVAIKRIDYAYSLSNNIRNVFVGRRIYREMVLLCRLRHPNMVTMLYAYTPAASVSDLKELYIVMEATDFTLDKADFHRDQKIISYVSYQILCGVHYLHKNGMIHRDLKPSNIGIISQSCTVKLLDFGIARGVQEGVEGYATARHWRAPEIIVEMEYNEKVDIWSIGCIVADLILGHQIFPGEDSMKQWEEMVKVLGTPHESFMNRIRNPAVLTYVKSLPIYFFIQWNRIIPEDRFSAATEHWEQTLDNARHFLSGLLVIDSEYRFSSTQALSHPYVRCWMKGNEVNLPTVDIQKDLEFGEKEGSGGVLRDSIFNMVKYLERTAL